MCLGWRGGKICARAPIGLKLYRSMKNQKKKIFFLEKNFFCLSIFLPKSRAPDLAVLAVLADFGPIWPLKTAKMGAKSAPKKKKIFFGKLIKFYLRLTINIMELENF